jgi:2-oxoglutarate ferredoxin oxidoreductase subunit alpha
MMAIEAFRLAVRAMSPVVYLSDGYLANSSEPWRIPDPDELPVIQVEHRSDPDHFMPYLRDEVTLGRPWVVPGTPGLEHRIGGLGKMDGSGNVSYTPQDHEHMIKIRAEKVQRLQNTIPEQQVFGPAEGDLLVVGWGGTYGAIRSAVAAAQGMGLSVAHAHVRYLNPFPRNLPSLLGRYRRVLVAELNLGQLAFIFNGRFGMKCEQLNKVQGQPFKISEVLRRIQELAR